MEHVNRSGHHSTGSGPLGNLIRTKREAAGLTLTQLASELGMSRPYLSRLEQGKYAHPSARALTHIVNRLDISVEDVYALTGYMLPMDLPGFGPYLRAKYAEWPEAALHELETFYEFLKHKYSVE